MKKPTQALTAKKQNLGEWYNQVMLKADLADYSEVSGCIVFKPYSYAIWEKLQSITDKKFKQIGIKNAYFPLFIPEKLLKKEAAHLKGFTPEVAWVTHAGHSKLDERLAIRPTSETIMYQAFSKWIRSHKDLPLRLNQWNNVVRWEFKHPVPFLRTREFLWNEGHTCFATKEEALAEQDQIIKIYQDVCENYLALPSLTGKKSELEKFAGAEYTISLEFVMPNGKAAQGPDFHHDGQNFSKAFDITFLDQKGNKRHVYQNTWAISTRMLGILFAIHGDNQGLILPPKIAPLQIVIIPILFEKTKTKTLNASKKIAQKLQKNFSTYLDAREDYSPGWKFNEWEVKGVPLRLEIGPKDLKNNQVTLVRRDTKQKQAVKLKALDKKVKLTLDQIQKNLLQKAESFLKSSISKVSSLQQAKKQINNKKIIFAPWCTTPKCEENINSKLDGTKSLNSPLKQPKLPKKCFACQNKAQAWFYFGKSY